MAPKTSKAIPPANASPPSTDINTTVDQVRGVVRKRAEGKGILVRILALRQQFSGKVSAADVMHQIAEFHAAKWVVTQIPSAPESASREAGAIPLPRFG